MRTLHLLSIIVLLIATGATVSPVFGQTWSDEQIEVWNVIEAQWKASMEKDDTWPDKTLHEKFLGWDNERPMPRDKSSIHSWVLYRLENSTTLHQELYPVGIIVYGNTAVAHYFYSQATEDRKGERETSHGHVTDVLVKENGTWQFLAWSECDNPTND